MTGKSTSDTVPYLSSETACPVTDVDTCPHMDVFASCSGWKTTICKLTFVLYRIYVINPEFIIDP